MGQDCAMFTGYIIFLAPIYSTSLLDDTLWVKLIIFLMWKKYLGYKKILDSYYY